MKSANIAAIARIPPKLPQLLQFQDPREMVHGFGHWKMKAAKMCTFHTVPALSVKNAQEMCIMAAIAAIAA